MNKRRELGFQDYIALVRRHLWLILVPAILMPIATYLVSLEIPNRYTSRALVLVDQQKVPQSFVKNVVGEELAGRLATMQQQILSRTRLQPIMERFGLFNDERLSMEEKIEKLRKTIEIEPVKTLITTKEGALPGFTISFSTSDAHVAQQVCGEILSMFVSENLRSREQSAEGTTEFLRTQLDEAKHNLDEQDAKLATFKERYIGQLPGQEPMNYSLLTSMNSRLDATTQALARAQQDKTFAEAMLNQQIADWQKNEGTDSPDLLEKQLSELQAALVRAEARYKPDHPDIVKLKADIAAITGKLHQESPAPTAKSTKATSEPLRIQQLRAQIHSMEMGIESQKQEQTRIQKQIGVYQGRLQLSPRVEEEFKKLIRDYSTASQFYNELLTKKTQSVMATDLERKQQGEQFRVMDPPNLPEKPTFPDRPMFALGGLGGGLAFGLGLAFLLELRDKSIRGEKDVEFYLKLPTLGLVPILDTTAGNGHKKFQFWRGHRATGKSESAVKG
jgi:protein tyrosine kinase modulator